MGGDPSADRRDGCHHHDRVTRGTELNRPPAGVRMGTKHWANRSCLSRSNTPTDWRCPIDSQNSRSSTTPTPHRGTNRHFWSSAAWEACPAAPPLPVPRPSTRGTLSYPDRHRRHRHPGHSRSTKTGNAKSYSGSNRHCTPATPLNGRPATTSWNDSGQRTDLYADVYRSIARLHEHPRPPAPPVPETVARPKWRDSRRSSC